ncbi:MAG: anaerobic carbon-monoxide dehydrogenase catalytic subunit [Candidatus Methanoperedens sp.]|nr:anaerobic carbon-monoxide dehydrogenase catalytic subunit [Candidatus Methanoperedens sp.]MCE8427782.1 anaerobic carbon-monoxide dehydrogenase catalytic subunit [Candidatus Methanoperedens sp.]
MEPVSAHTSIIKMHSILREDRITNSFDRSDAQGKRCSFCEQGISCQLCSNGPCRIKPGAERGVCGIDADAMAMRNLMFLNTMGTATYTFHAKEVAKTLKATAMGKTPFHIKDEAKLRNLALKLGIKSEMGTKEIAIAVADSMIAEINSDSDGELSNVLLFAPKSRIELWRKLGILPGGPLNEVMDATSSTMTNMDGDYVSLAKKAMRLGISCIYGSQIPLEIVQDVLFGTPQPHAVNVDLGIIDPAYVNIAANGHEPFIGAALIKAAHEAKNQETARKAGAKGLHIIGSIETGQELVQRFQMDDIFVGMIGNWLSIEPALATGGIDVFAMDMNCSPPGMGGYQDKYNTTLVSVSKLINVPGMKYHIVYKPEDVAGQAQKLIDIAIENFKKRKGKVTNQSDKKQNAVIGFSAEACLVALGGTLDPLVDVIKKGTLKGVVALVSCTTLRDGGQDINTLKIARELIKRDILVISAGCGNAALQVGGLTTLEAKEEAGPGLKAVCELLKIPPVLSFGTCTDTGRITLLVTAVADALGVDPSALPVAVTAPEYMEQKATIDAIFALAFGLYTHVAPLPPVAGAPRLVKLITQDIEGITGGKIAIETDMVEAANGIEAHIMKKRSGLGLPA